MPIRSDVHRRAAGWSLRCSLSLRTLVGRLETTTTAHFGSEGLVAKLGEYEGEGLGRHILRSEQIKGRLSFQLVESDSGKGLLNVVIKRSLRKPWANSIPVSAMSRVELEGGQLDISYGGAATLTIESPQAKNLEQRIKSQMAILKGDPSGHQSVRSTDQEAAEDADDDALLVALDTKITYVDEWDGPPQIGVGEVRVISTHQLSKTSTGELEVVDGGLALQFSIDEFGLWQLVARERVREWAMPNDDHLILKYAVTTVMGDLVAGVGLECPEAGAIAELLNL